MMEERAMLLEESVAQPVFQRSAGGTHLGEQLFLPDGVPILAVGSGEEFAQRSAAAVASAGLMGTMHHHRQPSDHPGRAPARENEPVWRGHW
jgi:hypothetical protein